MRLVGPAPPDISWQARAGQGFDIACFAIDWEAQHLTCPAGQTSVQWKPTHDGRGQPCIHIEFARQSCGPCPLRSQCTHAKQGVRELTIRPQAQYVALAAARAYQQTAGFAEEYAVRAGIEGTLGQGIRVCDLRRTRYRGLAKTRLQHLIIAVALNLWRMVAWWQGDKRAQTRISAFAALAPPTVIAHAGAA